MASTRDLITGALRLINVVQANEVPSAADIDVTREALGALMDSKSNDLLNIHTVTPYRFPLVPGQFKYALGPTGDWVTERPMRIEQSKLMLNPIIISPTTTDGVSTPASTPAGDYTHYCGINFRNGYDGDVRAQITISPAEPQTDLLGVPERLTEVTETENTLVMGLALGTVPNAYARTTAGGYSEVVPNDTFFSFSAYVPAVEGDVITVTYAYFAGYGFDYEVYFVVGTDADNGDKYHVTGIMPTEGIPVYPADGPQTLSCTFVESIGSRFPDATFTYPTESPAVDETVTFVNTSTGTNFVWDFGDDTTLTTATVEDVTHVYTNPGVYTVTLTATYAEGLEAVAEATVTVPGINSDSNTLFLPLKALEDEDFADIRQRNLTNQWPTVILDNGGYPQRELFVWPVPRTAQAVELWLWEPLSTLNDLDAELNLPQGYERYLRFRLALEVAPEFGKEISQSLADLASEAEARIKGLNQQVPIARTHRVFRNKPTSNYITFTSSSDTLPEPGDLP